MLSARPASILKARPSARYAEQMTCITARCPDFFGARAPPPPPPAPFISPFFSCIHIFQKEDGRLGFAFDGGVAYGILLTIRQVDNPRVLGTTNRDIRPVRNFTPHAPVSKWFC
jgi:hypothetical protein